MITLLTGIPGSGKTLNLIEMVMNECQGRDVYYHHIPELTLDWTEISQDDVLNWSDFPDGSVFVIDEVHQIWPRISVNKESHPSVQLLDEHRHRGFDFYIATQRPTKVDFRVRDMVGRHLHFERAFGINRSRILEWQKAVGDPDDYHERQEALKKTKSFNKKIFPLYKSSSMHTVKKRIPAKVYMVAASIACVIGLGLHLYNRLQDRQEDFRTATDDAVQVEEVDFMSQIAPGARRDLPLTTEQYVDTYTPRISDIPHSAPAYDELTKVKTFPRPQCIYAHQRETCVCYSQQATPLDISFSHCLNLVENGWFNPFVDENQERERARGSERALAAAPPPSEYNLPLEDRVIYLHVPTEPERTGSPSPYSTRQL